MSAWCDDCEAAPCECDEVVGFDCCHHGLGFDEICEDCEDEGEE